MPREDKLTRALRAIREGRVRVLRANRRGVALIIRSEHPDPDTLKPVVYRTVVWREDGRVLHKCSCANGRIHPVRPSCGHVALAELLLAEEE